MAGFLAYVMLIEGGGGNRPDNSLPGVPVYPDQGLPGAPPYPDQGLPGGGGRPPHVWPRPPGGPPFWGGGWGSGPRPDQGLPGSGAHPWLPGHLPGVPGSGHPSHPIYHPDKPVPPGTSPGAGMWVLAYVPGKGFVWTPVAPGQPEQPLPEPPEPTPT